MLHNVGVLRNKTAKGSDFYWIMILVFLFLIYKNRNSALHSDLAYLSVNVGINIATHANI